MTIEPKLLKQTMKKRGISQKMLADRLGKGHRTIARWLSSGIPKKSRLELQICDALGVAPEKLDPNWQSDLGSGKTVPVHALVSPAASNGFYFMNQKYGVTQTQIIEFAPVMFAVLAERALQLPREEFDDFRRRIIEFGFPVLPDPVAEAIVNAKLDLARKGRVLDPVPDPQFGTGSSLFIEMLNKLAEITQRFPKNAVSSSSGKNCPDSRDFVFDADALDEIARGDDVLKAAIVRGDIRLRTMDTELKSPDRAEERLVWLQKQAEEAQKMRRLELAAWTKENPELAKEREQSLARLDELLNELLRQKQ